MNEFTNPLENIRIASPCAADWNEMIGDERKRFCGDCRLNVYNLSGMTRREAENLLADSEGRLCVRFYRRADGTVLTKDCPIGWQALKRRVSKTATAFVSLLFGILSGLGFTAFFNQSKGGNYTTGTMTIESPNRQAMGEVEVKAHPTNAAPLMGKPAVNEVPDENLAIAGGIQNIDEVRRQVKIKRQR